MKKVHVKVVVPTVTGETLVTVDLEDYGLTEDEIASIRKARVVGYESSAGAQKVATAMTATFSPSAKTVAIGEPSGTGFETGDVVRLDLELEAPASVTGTASTP